MFTSRMINPSRVGAVALLALITAACGTSQPAPSAPTSHPPTAVPTLAVTMTPAPSPTAGATATPSQAPSVSVTPSASPSPTSGAASLLLEVTTEGGFIAPSARLGQLPTLVVDTDGNIYTPDPNFSGAQLIPQAVVRNVGTQGAAHILDAMRTAGLDKVTFDGGPTADAGVTVFTAEIDGQEVVNRVVAGLPGRPGGSPNPAVDLLNRLTDPTETWGASGATTMAFTPTAYKIYAAPATAGSQSPVAWPLSAGLDTFGTPATPDFGVTGLRTGVVFGNDAMTLVTAFATASADTRVTSGGKVYQVWIRPLLPVELS